MIGKVLAGYRIVDEIAEGGMGMVFRAESVESGQAAAVKVLRQELCQRREDIGRFIREAMIYKRLQHPNLIKFFHFGFEQEAGFFLITELLKGRDLEEAIVEQGVRVPFPLSQALDIALQICAGLATAHQEGIIHRDLKPGNIFLVSEGDGSEVVKIFDFGIGKLLEHERVTGMTVHGIAIGTPLYMAPEQVRGDSKKIGQGADIYALGVIIFQMVTGHLPFTGESPMHILAAQLKEEAPLLRKHQRFLAGTEFEVLIKSMMAKEAIDRPASLEDVKEALWKARQVLAPSETSNTMVELPSFTAFEDIFANGVSLDSMQSSSSSELEQPVAVLIRKKKGKEEEMGWLLPGENLHIGSDIGNGIRIKDKSIAPRHAELYASPEGWITIKRHQKTTVRVNGANISTMVLRDGDSITLGDIVLHLRCFSS